MLASVFVGSVALDADAVRGILRCLVTGEPAENKNLYNLIVQVRMPRICLAAAAGAV